MKAQDIIELEKKLKARELDVSKIDEKKHPRFGVVLTKNRALVALISAIVAAGGLLGLNAISVWAQNFSGLWGPSWGSIFGNGTNYMLAGISAATLEASAWAAGICVASLVPNAIRGIANYRNYKKMLNPNLTKEQKEKIAANELDYETCVTENLINKVNGRTHARSSAFIKAQDARIAAKNTNNPFKKAKFSLEAKMNEDLVNKSIKTLVERLNNLSIEKNNDWMTEEINNQGLLVPKKLAAADIIKKNEEMRKIQVFLAEILDKADKKDPYYSCLKHYLKKYHKTIELVNLPQDKPEIAEVFKNDISDELASGNIAKAIKNFCTYSPYIISKGKKTDLNETNDINDFLTSRYEAELEIAKSRENVKTMELDMHSLLERAKQSELKLQKLSIEGEGSATRLRMHDKNFGEKVSNANEVILEARQTLNELTTIKNNFISAYDEIVDKLNISSVHAKEIKNILKNSINDRTASKKDMAYIKTVKSQIKDLVKKAKAENLFNNLEKLIDLAFLSEQHIAVIEANLKETNKIKGKTSNALGDARNSARTAHTYSESAKDSAKKAETYTNSANKTAITAEEELRKATNSRRRIQGEEVTATLISGRMNQNMLDQKKKGDEHIASLAKKDEKATDILKAIEDKKAQIESTLNEVKDVVLVLKSLKANDVQKLKSGYIKIVKKLSAITNIQLEQEDRLDEIGSTLVASFSDIYTRLTKLNMHTEAQEFKEIFTKLQEIEKRVLNTEEVQKAQGKQIAKLSKNVVTLVSDIKLLNSFVQNHTSLINLINNTYFTINDDIKNKFTTLVKLTTQNSNNQQLLEEFASWTQHDLDKLTAVVNQLKLQVTELQTSQPATKKDEEDEKTKFNVPISEELAKQIKLYKNYAHSIHRALKDGNPLPTKVPTSMKGKKITQEEIAAMGGKNMDFSSKGMFKQEVLNISEKYLNKKEFAFVKRIMDIELAKQNEVDLEALIGLIEKACENYNSSKWGFNQ